MWEKLKKLGDPPSSKAILEIIRDDETISSDIQEVLSRWQNDISKLFSGIRENAEFAFGENFYQEILTKREELINISPEGAPQNPQYDSTELNSDMLFAEVSKCIEVCLN